MVELRWAEISLQDVNGEGKGLGFRTPRHRIGAGPSTHKLERTSPKLLANWAMIVNSSSFFFSLQLVKPVVSFPPKECSEARHA